MERLMRGRTAFMIAHRLSTLDICDVRIEIAQGRIVAISEHVAPTPLGGPARRGAGTAQAAPVERVEPIAPMRR